MQTAIPVLSFIPRPATPDIGNLGLLVHLAADSVADVLPDDSYPCRSPTSWTEAETSPIAGPGLDLADAGPHRLLRSR